MSKTIESLKKMPSREYALHEHIADTYFSKKTYKKKADLKTKKLKTALVASFAVAVFLVAIAGLSVTHKHYIAYLKEKTANSPVVKIFDSGRLNSQIISRFEFGGYAEAKSKIFNKMIVLHNTKKYNWADLSIDFKFPIDLSRRRISLSLKGAVGGEKICLILRDANNRSCRLDDIYLGLNWKTKNISLNNINGDLDLSKITQLRFESGYVGESSKTMDSLIDFIIYIKDINILKEA